MLKPNQSVHITIKEPPITVKSIGIFDDDSIIVPIIERFLSGNTPRNQEFKDNTREEIYLLLAQSKVLTVAVESDVYTITIRKTQ